MITQAVRSVHTASYILIGSRAKEASAVLHNGKQQIKQVHQGLFAYGTEIPPQGILFQYWACKTQAVLQHAWL